jgi:hypothetical protein
MGLLQSHVGYRCRFRQDHLTPVFAALVPRAVRWSPVQGVGLEHLTLRPDSGGIVAESVVIGERGGKPYGLTYRIDCSAAWCVRAFRIMTTDGRGLSLLSDGAGHWRSIGGRPRPEFDGCVDIDLAGTPFTNTLPIRRLGLAPEAGTVELEMLYVPFDDFLPLRDAQRYTCLEAGRLYRYEAADRSFTADLPVDEHGLVGDYPTLFNRA